MQVKREAAHETKQALSRYRCAACEQRPSQATRAPPPPPPLLPPPVRPNANPYHQQRPVIQPPIGLLAGEQLLALF